jgi:uncharacterized protein (UPF0276 family)
LTQPSDRVGISWRPQLAAGIFANLDKIDVVEVIADDYFDAPPSKRAALQTLAAQVPVQLHGITQGLGSTVQAEQSRLSKMARLLEIVCPECWSEHLAFVRGGGLEIGHMAAPPRNMATVEGTCRNIELARRVTGMAPHMENIATLIDPPGSSMPESEWTAAVLANSGCKLVLDLHNLHANATNFHYDPMEFLDRIPCEQLGSVHIAGGSWLQGGRILDDHLHDVEPPVYALLTALAARVRQPLTVVLERDGNFQGIRDLLRQLEQARAALALGREKPAA